MLLALKIQLRCEPRLDAEFGPYAGGHEEMVKQLIPDQLHLMNTVRQLQPLVIHIGGSVKIQLMKMPLILGLLINVGNVPARAQALIEGSIEADVPFAFIVNETTLPAGKYIVRRLDETEPHVLEIRSANGRTSVIFEAENAQIAQRPRNAELVFSEIGDQHFLSQIWADDTDIGYQLPKTKAQNELEDGGMRSEHRSILAKVFKKTKKPK